MKPSTRLPFGAALSACALALGGCEQALEALPTQVEEPSAPQSPRTADLLPGDEAFDDLLEAFDVPGMGFATLTKCEVDRARSVGLANVETSERVTNNTAFEAASLSKPVFAYLVLQLVDEGIIDLDAPLAPFPYPRITDQDAFAEITPRMILTHRTGLPNWSGDSQDETRTDPIAFRSAPGETHSYSGEAFELLRAYVVAKTEMSLHELFVDRLGDAMPNSSFNGRLRGEAKPSRGYRSSRDASSGRDLYLIPHETGAAWGLITTASDYAAFLSEVCKADVLSPGTQADMLRPQAPLPRGEMPGPAAYGLGWVIFELGSETIVNHSGNNDEYRAFTAYLPETGEGYVFLTNGRNGEDMIGAIMQSTAP
ncbi:MAG: serine hydrolase domain-containing protein [Pseudomonadota bacterium]